MRRLGVLVLLFASQFCFAQPASACMWREVYPALWREPPLFPAARDEVVIRAELVAHAARAERNVTDCSGGIYVFRVEKVLQGSFGEREIAIRLPTTGGFFDTPEIGDQRVIVGRLAGPINVGDRLVDNMRDLRRQGLSYDQALEHYAFLKSGGPSVVMSIEPRPPTEQRLLFALFYGRSIWTMIGLGAAFLTVAGLGVAWLLRRRHGGARGAK